MSLKIKKGIPLIDNTMTLYGGKFGGNFIPALKKPIDDLTKLF